MEGTSVPLLRHHGGIGEGPQLDERAIAREIREMFLESVLGRDCKEGEVIELILSVNRDSIRLLERKPNIISKAIGIGQEDVIDHTLIIDLPTPEVRFKIRFARERVARFLANLNEYSPTRRGVEVPSQKPQQQTIATVSPAIATDQYNRMATG